VSAAAIGLSQVDGPGSNLLANCGRCLVVCIFPGEVKKATRPFTSRTLLHCRQARPSLASLPVVLRLLGRIQVSDLNLYSVSLRQRQSGVYAGDESVVLDHDYWAKSCHLTWTHIGSTILGGQLNTVRISARPGVHSKQLSCTSCAIPERLVVVTLDSPFQYSQYPVENARYSRDS
jgi:hypothetical protein